MCKTNPKSYSQKNTFWARENRFPIKQQAFSFNSDRLLQCRRLSAKVYSNAGHYYYLKNIGGTDWTPNRFIAS